MAEPRETLIFVARLTCAEQTTIAEQEAAFPGSNLRIRLHAAVEDVCLDRLGRADGCIEMAKLIARADDEESLRTAVGRGYYSAHHSVRVMALWWNKWDPDGHQESLKQLKKLLTHNDFCGRSGLAPEVHSRLVEARTNRHVADYSPYAVQRTPPDVRPNETITGNAWRDAANFNIQVAGDLLKAALKIIGS